ESKRNPQGSRLRAFAFRIPHLNIVKVVGVCQKAQKQQQVEQLMSQQQKIVAEQRAAVGELKNVGLSEQGKKNLENTIRSPMTAASPTSTLVSSPYQCDGRQHCSQMNSRAEAEWFVRNCSDNKMDGDRDGIPCENDSRW
ncbi:excalibur calcium-binding domain-containing protein, partial [Acinetobacter wanghuae]|uniref:excalibur calcium-binding domain-containing protein n=1 Tax=Acinetobacter wanghuae TaxID=2662362 RepID=UPI003AF56A1C